MNKKWKVFQGVVFLFCVCVLLSGCSVVQNQIDKYSDGKEQCFLNDENVTQLTYKGESYTILEDTVTKETLGEWVGYIRRLVVVDEKYIIPFQNVYTALNDTSYLIVDVKGGYHKAIPSEQLTDENRVFDYKSIAEETSSNYELNPQNATQIISGNRIYQVTLETVENEQLGCYLGILAEKVTFDADTKLPLQQEELIKIDWTGISAGQKRECWFYMDVYEISGTDIQEAVAVKVNDQYYVAKVQ